MNRKKKYVLFVAILFVMLPVLLVENSSLIEAPNQSKIDARVFRRDMRKLWEDHSEKTRQLIITTLSDLPNQNETIQNLIQNQNEIGNAIKPFYGDQTSDELSELLKEHTEISVIMLQAARKADPKEFEASVARWYANADEIAEFLQETNQENWPFRKTKPMFRIYLDLTLEEALARWKGDFAASDIAHDKVRTQALEIADMLSDGLINRFRRKFK